MSHKIDMARLEHLWNTEPELGTAALAERLGASHPGLCAAVHRLIDSGRTRRLLVHGRSDYYTPAFQPRRRK